MSHNHKSNRQSKNHFRRSDGREAVKSRSRFRREIMVSIPLATLTQEELMSKIPILQAAGFHKSALAALQYLEKDDLVHASSTVDKAMKEIGKK